MRNVEEENAKAPRSLKALLLAMPLLGSEDEDFERSPDLGRDVDFSA